MKDALVPPIDEQILIVDLIADVFIVDMFIADVFVAMTVE